MRRSVPGVNDYWVWMLLDDLTDIPLIKPGEIHQALRLHVVKRGNARRGQDPRQLRTDWPKLSQNEIDALRMLATGWTWLDLVTLFGGKGKLDRRLRDSRFKLRAHTLEHAIAIALRTGLLDLEPIRDFRVGVSRKRERVGFLVSSRARPTKLKLSKRRKEVLTCLAVGLTFRQTAEKWGDSDTRRVRETVRSAKLALGAQTRYEAIANAIRMGLLFDDEEGHLKLSV